MRPCTQLAPVSPTNKTYKNDVPEVSIGWIWLIFEHQLGYYFENSIKQPCNKRRRPNRSQYYDWLNALRLANRRAFPQSDHQNSHNWSTDNWSSTVLHLLISKSC